jgi:hypothetical protein
MKTIKAIYFHHLRNEAHYQYLVEVQRLLYSYSTVAVIVEDLLPPFYVLIALEGKLVDGMKASIYTEEVAEADQRVDRSLVGINSSITAGLHHFDPAIVKAAKALELRLKAFRGSIEKKSYEEEAAAVSILIADLQGEYAPQVAAVGIGTWVTELAAAHTKFEKLFDARDKERSIRPQERIVDVRRKVDGDYHQIVERIDAYNVLHAGDPKCILFVNELNTKITYFNDHNHHHAHKDFSVGDHTEITAIGTQPHTGKPITVVPEVHYHEDGKAAVELSLGADFSVTYKNNINVGMAELTIHGKGAYRGQKSTTFNIAE